MKHSAGSDAEVKNVTTNKLRTIKDDENVIVRQEDINKR